MQLGIKKAIRGVPSFAKTKTPTSLKEMGVLERMFIFPKDTQQKVLETLFIDQHQYIGSQPSASFLGRGSYDRRS